MTAILFLGLVACLLSACNDEVDVQQSYPFKVETLPVPTRIVKGETVEIRCELKREGRFSDARYTIRYFQPDGKGTLRMDDGMVLLPNDRYPLDREVFRLYYTSESEDQQTIDIYFEDNSEPAQLCQLTFDFNNETEDEDSGILVLRLVVEVKSQLAKLCRFAIVLEIDVYRLLVLAFRSVV